MDKYQCESCLVTSVKLEIICQLIRKNQLKSCSVVPGMNTIVLLRKKKKVKEKQTNIPKTKTTTQN